jgi:hypothetical protein
MQDDVQVGTIKSTVLDLRNPRFRETTLKSRRPARSMRPDMSANVLP